MHYISNIGEWTEEYLRDICVMAVGTCALIEETDPDSAPFWLMIFSEVRRRGWGDLDKMAAVEMAVQKSR